MTAKTSTTKSSSSSSEADAAAGGSTLTKRQRHKQKNNKHSWPQHPKISSPAARAKVYLRTSGLLQQPQKSIDATLDLHSPEIKFGRLLGATDQRVRHQAVLQLQAYLKARCDIHNQVGGISELDLMKLWKGLWYTLYMADRQPVQEELAKQIAQLVWCLAGTEEEDEYAGQAYLDIYGDDGTQHGSEEESDEENVIMEEIENTLDQEDDDDDEQDEENASSSSSNNEDEEDQQQDDSVESDNHDQDVEELDDSEIPHCRGAHLASYFVRTFFRTVHRDWGKLDKYRVDKFYTLMRLMMHEVFEYMAVRHWNLGIIRLFNDAIYEEVLSRTPNGLRYHLIDLVLDELAKVHKNSPMPLTEATFLDCLEPYFAMAQTGAGDDTVQQRVVENVLTKFLDDYSIVHQDAEDEEEDVIVFDQVHVGTISQFIFELASDGATKDRYRKSLYDIHKKYVRRLKQVGRDVELEQEDEEEEFAKDNDAQVEQQEVEDNDDEIDLKEELVEMVELEEQDDEDVGTPVKTMEKKKAADIITSEPEPTGGSGARKRKKKKKNRKNSEGSAEPPQQEQDEHQEDEEITISFKDQKKARAAMKPKSKGEDKTPTKKQKTKHSKEEIEEEKRVKFSAQNEARSWKASMKALRTKDVSPPKTSPSQGILRRSSQSTKTKTKVKKSRTKATNF